MWTNWATECQLGPSGGTQVYEALSLLYGFKTACAKGFARKQESVFAYGQAQTQNGILKYKCKTVEAYNFKTVKE